MPKKKTRNYPATLATVLILVFCLGSSASAATVYDVNGDGQEGLPEAIHSLQVLAGLSPSSSTIVYVGPVGTSLENGTALLDALDGISDAGITKPYLLKIEPGIYDLGNNGLTMKAFVDIEGSGQQTTTITSTHSGSSQDYTSATITGMSSAEIRFLTIENRGGGNCSMALYNNFSSPAITRVTAIASGGTLNRGIYNISSNPFMTDITLDISGGTSSFGIYNYSYSSPSMTNVSITVQNGSSETVGVVNGTYSSPSMTNVLIVANGGTGDNNCGIDNSTYSSPSMFKVSAIVSGTGTAYGVHNYSHSSPVMTMVTTNVSGGASSYGLYNDYYCSPSVTGLSVSNATQGVHNLSASYPVIRDSAISGSSYSIVNQSSADTPVKVANTLLDGVVSGSGSYACIGAYDQTFSALNASCH